MTLARQHLRRRGTGIAALILLLAVLNIAVMGVLAAGSDESDLSVSRARTARAFYAAESAGIAAIRLLESNQALPTSGQELDLGAATASYDTVTVTAGSGHIVVTGTSGDAQRRIEIEFSVQ